ncbi:hypothetical protein JCM6882_002174 [Rhodosporidiobolus microsporus]
MGDTRGRPEGTPSTSPPGLIASPSSSTATSVERGGSGRSSACATTVSSPTIEPQVVGTRREPSTNSSSSSSAAPTPRHSVYQSLPSPPVDLSRLRGSSVGASYEPQYPFPPSNPPSRSGSLEDLRSQDSSPSSPTWPDPSSYTFAPTSRAAAIRETKTTHHRTGHPSLAASLTHALKPRSLLSSKLTRFEVALVDRLADFLEEDQGLESIVEASGIVGASVVGERGRRKFVCTGSASAVNKARALVDARLSQTPIRIRLSIRLPVSTPSILSFSPSPSTARVDRVSVVLPTYRLVRSAPPPPPPPVQHSPVRPRLYRATSSGGSRSRPNSFHAVYANGVVGPFRCFSGSSPNATPSSERSGESFFTAVSSPSAASPTPSPSSATTSVLDLLGLNDSNSPLPQVGSFDAHRGDYINAVVDELQACVNRRSLVRLKVVIGQQGWLLHDAEQGVPEKKEWPVDEVEGWKVDTSRPVGTPHFDYAMSRETVSSLVECFERRGLSKKKSSSQVHILHLDRYRAVYAVATAEVRGQDLRNLPPGQCANGTLSLKKCSTLPSKPFSLSISTPGTLEPLVSAGEGESEEPRVRLVEGTDMRVKVLADKSATSTSIELSAAMQDATWWVDDDGVFSVHARLDPARFSESQTSIRWAAKDRWEDDTFRATVSENRHDGSSSQTWEVDLTSRRLNAELAECTLDQLRKKFDREKVAGMVEELVRFCEGVVDERVEMERRKEEGTWGAKKGAVEVLEEKNDDDEEEEEGVEDLEEELASGMVATAGVSPLESPPQASPVE